MVYRQISTLSAILLTVQGLLLALLFVLAVGVPHNWQWVVFVPCIVMYMLYRLMWHKLRGYTGDCCGAMFLLVELSVYLAINIA